MKKRLLTTVFAVFVLTSGLAAVAGAVGAEIKETATVNVRVGGELLDMSVPAMLIGGTTYVPIRDFSAALGAERTAWDGETATVTAPGFTIEAYTAGSYIVANGRYLLTPAACRVSSDELTVPVRTLAKAFDAVVSWEGETRTVIITKGDGSITPGSEFYDSEDVQWMSRIIKAEAGGESLEGKIAVGNVVMNRIESPSFPDSVYSVVFDKRNGIQFTPAYSGAIHNTPDWECVVAAKIALDGGNVAGDSLYFSSKWVSCWAARNRPYTMTIGNHAFYA